MNDPECTLPSNLTVWNPTDCSVVTQKYNGTLTGTSSIKNDISNLKAFPIPANELVTVSFPETLENGQIQIYNSLGAEIQSILVSLGSKFQEINISHYLQELIMYF